ncbi:MAG: guanylate kinase [Coriobacteriales bacterium]|nr:guanylate kinase [Coriobacteriales bacterium]
MSGVLFVISGPSGVGKGTLVKILIEKIPSLALSISATTRKPRIGDADGVTYFFMTKEDFEQKISQGAFLEYANVHGNYYGTLQSTVDDLLDEYAGVILEIDVQGGHLAKLHYKDAVTIFIDAPSEEEIKNRLIGRGSDVEENFELRLANAQKERESAKDYDFHLINDDLNECANNLIKVIKSYIQ